MNRKEFIVKTCGACLGAAAISGLLSSCAATQFTTGQLTKDGLLIDTKEFETKENTKEFETKEKGKYRLYIVVRNDELLYPVCVYRFSENDYAALWMQCAHQGAESCWRIPAMSRTRK